MASSQPELPPLREVIARHNLSARHALGQHYLLDSNITDRMVRTAGNLTGNHVIEIGPGPGGLTRSLLKQGTRHVTAIERDLRCIPALKELQQVYPDRLTVIEGDALKIDPVALCAKPRKIIANLPYNIATPLIIGWLRNAGEWDSLTLMLQKEVAERIAGKPNMKSYGRLSVIVQWLSAVKLEFNVNKQAFVPPPKVMSSVISLTPHNKPEWPVTAISWTALETVTQAAFGQRRKMIRSSLKPLGINLEALGIDPKIRAENLSIKDFCRLAEAYVESN